MKRRVTPEPTVTVEYAAHDCLHADRLIHGRLRGDFACDARLPIERSPVGL
jgi:hypothetical protein